MESSPFSQVLTASSLFTFAKNQMTFYCCTHFQGSSLVRRKSPGILWCLTKKEVRSFLIALIKLWIQFFTTSLRNSVFSETFQWDLHSLMGSNSTLLSLTLNGRLSSSLLRILWWHRSTVRVRRLCLRRLCKNWDSMWKHSLTTSDVLFEKSLFVSLLICNLV